MNHPSLSSSGKRIAFLIALLVVFALPKRVECFYPGDECHHATHGRPCVTYELEPFGFYLIELVAKTDVGFGYSTTEECR
ncbi:MAG: hypothetical protein ABI867_19395 [Kofleriaceae bacterium]